MHRYLALVMCLVTYSHGPIVMSSYIIKVSSSQALVGLYEELLSRTSFSSWCRCQYSFFIFFVRCYGCWCHRFGYCCNCFAFAFSFVVTVVGAVDLGAVAFVFTFLPFCCYGCWCRWLGCCCSCFYFVFSSVVTVLSPFAFEMDGTFLPFLWFFFVILFFIFIFSALHFLSASVKSSVMMIFLNSFSAVIIIFIGREVKDSGSNPHRVNDFGFGSSLWPWIFSLFGFHHLSLPSR